jgi:hypothetical protein
MSGDPKLPAMLSGRHSNRGVAVKLGSITQAIREEISKLNQVLHLLEGRAKKTTRAKARGKISAAGRRKNCSGPKSKVGEDQGREVE